LLEDQADLVVRLPTANAVHNLLGAVERDAVIKLARLVGRCKLLVENPAALSLAAIF